MSAIYRVCVSEVPHAQPEITRNIDQWGQIAVLIATVGTCNRHNYGVYRWPWRRCNPSCPSTSCLRHNQVQLSTVPANCNKSSSPLFDIHYNINVLNMIELPLILAGNPRVFIIVRYRIMQSGSYRRITLIASSK